MLKNKLFGFIFCFIIIITLFVGCGINENQENSDNTLTHESVITEELEIIEETEEVEDVTYPWDNGGKLPKDYTWEEYNKLDNELQMPFYHWFGSVEAFDEWMLNAQGKSSSNNLEGSTDAHTTYPWDNGGKLPKDYTWKEYNDLDKEYQIPFFRWFGSVEEFDKWMKEAKK